MQTVENNTIGLIEATCPRYALLIELTLSTGTIFRWTTHNQRITFETNNYTPEASLNLSAMKFAAGLREGNTELTGAIVSSGLTYPYLASGVVSGAKVTIKIVDWRYPWAGVLNSMLFYVQKIQFNDEAFSLDLASLVWKIARPTANTYGRTCRHTLGDTQCGVNLGVGQTANNSTGGTYNVSYTGRTVTSVTTNKETVEFAASALASTEDGWWRYGKVTWTSGNNNGITMEVKAYTNSTRLICLQLPTIFDIEVGDTFSIVTGCNKTLLKTGGCNQKFANKLNYGGFPYVPAPDFTLKNPAGIQTKIWENMQ